MKRYFCKNPDSGKLDETESHHCLTVMRHQVGDVFTIFNGEGREFNVRITEIRQRQVFFESIAEDQFERPAGELCLAQAITKPKSMDWILQKMTEIGVSRFVPIQAERSVSQIPGERAEHKLSKWRQITIDAAKQSGQHWLPEISSPVSVRSFVADSTKWDVKLIASLQPDAQSLKSTLREFNPTLQTRIVFLIGPEGDFTPTEYSEAREAGFIPVSLGPVVLRSETAATYVLSALRYELS